MVKSLPVYLLLYFLTSILGSNDLSAESWNLPLRLDGNSMKINFSLDSTWHTVHGEVKNHSGLLRLVSANGNGILAATLTIRSNALDTNNEGRDSKMRKVMESAAYPFISISVPSIIPSCKESEVTVDHNCSYESHGTITIRDVTLPIMLQGEIARNVAGDLFVNGESSLDWSIFGIHDPSILVARVDKLVSIAFEITIPPSR